MEASRFILFALALLRPLVIASPLPDTDTDALGISFDATPDLPLLKLPYATYRASSYDKDDDVRLTCYLASLSYWLT